MRLYPSASIPVDTKKGFEAHARKKFCARIATGGWDAIIIGHSQFERIPISRERRLNGQADEIAEGITEVKAPSCERFAVKQLERAKKSLEARPERPPACRPPHSAIPPSWRSANRFLQLATRLAQIFLGR